MQGLQNIKVLENEMYVRSEAVDGGDGRNWDEKVFREVVDGDCYGLRAYKEKNPDASNFIDIGANIGAFIFFVKQLWPASQVIAAEPLGDNFELLKLNTAGLSNVKIINRAVIGTKDDEIGFIGPTLVTKTRTNYFSGADGKVSRNCVTRVLACQFHELCADLDSVDFLKIDCEGSEGEIFESIAGSDDLKKIKFISGEWHGQGMAARVENALRGTHSFKVTKSIFSDLGSFEAAKL